MQPVFYNGPTAPFLAEETRSLKAMSKYSVNFFLRKDLFHRQTIIKFVIYGSELVGKYTLLAQFKINSKFIFFSDNFVISS